MDDENENDRFSTKELMSPTSSTSISEETAPLLGANSEIKVYRRRWYVLIVFSYCACLQTAVWNTFGPIAQSAKLVFGWTDGQIGLFALWGNVTHFLFMFPLAYVLDVKGLRLSVIIASSLIIVGVSIRCITTDPYAATWMMNIGAILNGIAGCISYAGPALVSSTWFPPGQRATATAFGTMFANLGNAVAFIVGPLVVPEPTSVNAFNKTEINITSNQSDVYNLTASEDFIEQRDGIMRLMYIEAVAAGLLFVSVLVYFPAKPPSPPCVTASLQRESYTQGLKYIFRRKQFVIILLAFSVSFGTFGSLGPVLNVLLDGINVSQTTSGWIGFYSTLCGCLASLLISRIADIFVRRMKVILIVFFILESLAMTWCLLLRLEYIEFNMASLYTSLILAGVFVNGSVPLFVELGCESSYPIAEGVTAGALTLGIMLVGIIFFSVMQIQNIGVLWMVWTMLGAAVVTIPLLLLFKETYTRMDIDIIANTPQQTVINANFKNNTKSE